jgi:hypothetical protein
MPVLPSLDQFVTVRADDPVAAPGRQWKVEIRLLENGHDERWLAIPERIYATSFRHWQGRRRNGTVCVSVKKSDCEWNWGACESTVNVKWREP